MGREWPPTPAVHGYGRCTKCGTWVPLSALVASGCCLDVEWCQRQAATLNSTGALASSAVKGPQ